MSVEGLRDTPRLGDQVGATVEALRWLGLVDDLGKVRDSVSAQFDALYETGAPGEPYIQLPQKVCSLSGLSRVAYYGYPSTRPIEEDDTYAAIEPRFTDPLWIPGRTPNSYGKHEIGNLVVPPAQSEAWTPHARLAVYNTASYMPRDLLHFRNQPFDARSAAEERERKGYAESIEQQTQLEGIATATDKYEGCTVAPLNANGLAMVALVRRVQGLPMPLTAGYERLIDATIPRRTFDEGNPPETVSVVPAVSIRGNSVRLETLSGYPDPHIGVGLSIRPNAA